MPLYHNDFISILINIRHTDYYATCKLYGLIDTLSNHYTINLPWHVNASIHAYLMIDKAYILQFTLGFQSLLMQVEDQECDGSQLKLKSI